MTRYHPFQGKAIVALPFFLFIFLIKEKEKEKSSDFSQQSFPLAPHCAGGLFPIIQCCYP
jgi:hypothetical protein